MSAPHRLRTQKTQFDSSSSLLLSAFSLPNFILNKQNKHTRRARCELLDLKVSVETLCGNTRTKHLAFLRLSKEVVEMEHELVISRRVFEEICDGSRIGGQGCCSCSDVLVGRTALVLD
ncbi:hypothetical protein Droror1_Dr00021666 [Drosera rotundifolia]